VAPGIAQQRPGITSIENHAEQIRARHFSFHDLHFHGIDTWTIRWRSSQKCRVRLGRRGEPDALTASIMDAQAGNAETQGGCAR
jgi:hypothetical protein